MSVTEAGEIKKISASGTAAEADFSDLVKGVYIKSDGNVYVAFDRDATTNDFLVESADGTVFFNVNCTQVSAITSGASVNVYLIGVR